MLEEFVASIAPSRFDPQLAVLEEPSGVGVPAGGSLLPAQLCAGPSRSAASSDEEHSDHARTPSRVTSPPMVLSPMGAAAAVAPAPVSPSDISQYLRSQLSSTIMELILVKPPRLRVPRRRRAVECTFSPPRHSGRLVAKSRCRAFNLTVQAQNVLMAKWGVRQQDQAPQADAEGDFDEFMALFGGPLSESKREAIRMLFPAGCAIEGIQLVEGVDLEV